jgi:hypothetical protein
LFWLVISTLIIILIKKIKVMKNQIYRGGGVATDGDTASGGGGPPKEEGSQGSASRVRQRHGRRRVAARKMRGGGGLSHLGPLNYFAKGSRHHAAARFACTHSIPKYLSLWLFHKLWSLILFKTKFTIIVYFYYNMIYYIM